MCIRVDIVRYTIVSRIGIEDMIVKLCKQEVIRDGDSQYHLKHPHKPRCSIRVH